MSEKTDQQLDGIKTGFSVESFASVMRQKNLKARDLQMRLLSNGVDIKMGSIRSYMNGRTPPDANIIQILSIILEVEMISLMHNQKIIPLERMQPETSASTITIPKVEYITLLESKSILKSMHKLTSGYFKKQT